MSARANSTWIAKVTVLLRQGLGSEDIAVRLKCPVEDVRREIEIRRQSGDLTPLIRSGDFGPTAKKLMKKGVGA